MLCTLLNLFKPNIDTRRPPETAGLLKESVMASEVVSIPKLDFSPLESGTTGVWDALQGQVMDALESYGCFEVEYDRVTPELRDELFGRALPELFALPLETKMLNNSDLLLGGYIGQVPGWDFESLRLQDDVDKFILMLWPQGNPTFRDTVSTYIKHMKALEQTIIRMIFLGLGIEKYHDSYIESTKYETQLLEYGTTMDQEKKNGMKAHYDQNLVTVLCRNLVRGLEIQTKEGEWIPVVPTPNSYTVIIGEAMKVWTNGRLHTPFHYVRTNNNNVKRYTIIYGSIPKDGCVIQTPKELVDEKHPLVCKPYIYQEQILFRYSEKETEPGVPKEERQP